MCAEGGPEDQGDRYENRATRGGLDSFRVSSFSITDGPVTSPELRIRRWTVVNKLAQGGPDALPEGASSARFAYLVLSTMSCTELESLAKAAIWLSRSRVNEVNCSTWALI